jgi:aldehyde dehydrogenase (NAD+)
MLVVVSEVDCALAHLRAWTAREAVPVPAALAPASAYVLPEPKGVVLLIGPFNFPIQLLLNPLVSAVSAGNAAVLKPSELTPKCAVLLQRLVTKYLDTDAIKVVQGAVPETTALLRERYDHILYTGNGAGACGRARGGSVCVFVCAY